jgi:hypothetical protein
MNNRNDSKFKVYDHNDNGQYYKTIILAKNSHSYDSKLGS